MVVASLAESERIFWSFGLVERKCSVCKGHTLTVDQYSKEVTCGNCP